VGCLLTPTFFVPPIKPEKDDPSDPSAPRGFLIGELKKVCLPNNRVLNMFSSASSSSNKRKRNVVDLSFDDVPVETLENVSNENAENVETLDDDVPVETLDDDVSVETLVETLENVENEETFDDDVPVETFVETLENAENVETFDDDVPVTTFEDVPDPIHIYHSASIQVNDAVRIIQAEYNDAQETHRQHLRDALEQVNNIVEAQYQMRIALRQIDRYAVPNEDLRRCLEAVKQMKNIARRELRGTLPGDEEREEAILPFIDARIERRRREGNA
jgi:hypothetical protein